MVENPKIDLHFRSKIQGRELLRKTGRYIISSLFGFKNKHVLNDIKTYCMFIGPGRCGHTLIGTLLDAHPNIIISDGLDTLKYVEAGFKKNQIFSLILQRAKRFARQGKIRGEYHYLVPNQWQGKFNKKISVIGDKHARNTILRLHYHPRALSQLRNTINGAKYIHAVRNPYDNITTIAFRDKLDIKDAIDYYFGICSFVAEMKTQIDKNDILEIHHEMFIQYPKLWLKKTGDFLNVEMTDDYLNDCVGIVYKSPRKSRYDIEWTDELKELVKNKMLQFDFLKEYSFDN